GERRPRPGTRPAGRQRGSLRGGNARILREGARGLPRAGAPRTAAFPDHRCRSAPGRGRAAHRGGSRGAATAGAAGVSSPGDAVMPAVPRVGGATPVPPWTAAQRVTLTAAFRAGRFPHALLIHEAPGAGGEWLATPAAQPVLCPHNAQAACGGRA